MTVRAPRVPRIVHYCFGLSPDFGGMPWGLVHYVCLKSAIAHIQPTVVYFHCEHLPTGPWWELAKPLVSVRRIEAPREIFGNRLHHPAHQSDVVRLQMLLDTGGIYLDADLLVVRDFEPLLDASCVMGRQGDGDAMRGLCNAVILAEPRAPFLEAWLDAFRFFRSQGQDAYWDELGVRVPARLAQEMAAHITILDSRSFFWPLYSRSHLAWMFASSRSLEAPNAFAHHLWESAAWDEFIADLSVRSVRQADTNFNRLARGYLRDLPDDFCAPALSDWMQRRWRRGRVDLAASIERQRRKLARAIRERRA